MPKSILLIESCDFISYPLGGQLTFVKHLMKSFGDDLKLAGLSSDNNVIGKWSKINIMGIEYDYFAFCKVHHKFSKPILPMRLKIFFSLKKYRKRILSKGINNVFIQSFEIYLAIYNWKIKNVCYCFPGIENSLAISRYWYARLFSSFLDYYFLPKLKSAELILAAADNNSIRKLKLRANKALYEKNIIQFPTRANTSIFYKKDKIESRKKLNLPFNKKIFLTSGRLGWFKGWKFLIDSFSTYNNKFGPECALYFVGDGEDFNQIKDYISNLNLNNFIFLIGSKPPDILAEYLNAGDVFLMGSYKEGWSTTLVEAVLCGIPACVTDFSSAKEIIMEGTNGYVSSVYDKNVFSTLMNEALQINSDILPLEETISKFSVNTLKNDLLKYWVLIND